jgi:uncharacterized membrane protein YkvA (DUF1232 family)
MKNLNETIFNDVNFNSIISEHEQQAESLLKDKKKTNAMLQKALDLIDKIKNLPIIGELVDDIVLTVELIGKYIKGEYTAIPVRVIFSALAAIIYIVSPIDLIPDTIPVIGFIDDATVLTIVLGTGLSTELDHYRKWKQQKDKDKLDKIISEYEMENCLYSEEE